MAKNKIKGIVGKVKNKKVEKQKDIFKNRVEKKIDKMRRERKDDNFSYPKKLDVKGVTYIREDEAVNYANEMPEEIRNGYLIRRRRVWYKPWTFVSPEEEEFMPRGNMLFLMDNEGNLRIFDKIKSGVFRINDTYNVKKPGEEPKHIVLKPNKLRNIVFEDEKGNEHNYKCWIADINNAVALPENPMYDCEDVADVINKVITGNREFNKKDGGFDFIKFIPWIFGVFVVLYLGYILVTKNLFGIGDLVGYGKEPVKEVVKQVVVNNATNGTVVPGGSLS